MKNWWNNLEDSTQRLLLKLFWVLYFLIAAVPFIVWAAIAPGQRPYLLETLAWVWPVVLVGAGFIAVVGYMIYETVKYTP